MFALQLISAQDDRRTAPWTDDARLELGTPVEISLGYGALRNTLIVGEITALEPAFTIGGSPTLGVRGYDKRHRLNAAPRQQTFKDKKDSEIAEEICKRVNVPITVIDSKVTHAYVAQVGLTDLKFLQTRAKRIDFELAVAPDGNLAFRPVASDKSSIMRLTLNDDLLEFHPRMALVPMTSFELLAYDVKKKEAIKATAKGGDEVGIMGVVSAAQRAAKVFGTVVETAVRESAFTQAEADAMARARFNQASLDFIQGGGRVRGRTDLRAGCVIHLDELGTRFSGDYYVNSVVHSYSRRDGYLTDFQVKRNAS
jgi:phage protein D